jgi:hypothetical protein
MKAGVAPAQPRATCRSNMELAAVWHKQHSVDAKASTIWMQRHRWTTGDPSICVLVIGVMDLRTMAVVTVAITVERSHRPGNASRAPLEPLLSRQVCS